MKPKILVVIPARGGSKGIPRKNLRLLNGKPLIYYAISTALQSKYVTDCFVSSDDDEILNTARKFGAKVYKRSQNIADDKTTLDPVIYDCYKSVEFSTKTQYDIIITMQPTSPLLSYQSLDSAIELLIANKDIDTVIAAKDSTHLSWRKENGKFVPNYTERLNRQYLTPTYTETGAFLITRSTIISENSRIGENTQLSILANGEEIDIDTYEDWNICEYYLKKKKILFVVTGNKIVGLGHVYNTLLVANDILNHSILFLVDKDSQLAKEKIESNNYPVFIQKHENIVDDILHYKPDIVINDRLDTKLQYIDKLKNNNIKVINFEDLGSGAKNADLVINAIYPEKEMLPNHFFGQDYFILRDEFIYSELKEIKSEVREVLLTFGGVDPNNFTHKVIDSIYDYCQSQNIRITVITGFGYSAFETLAGYELLNIVKNVSNISDYMLKADVIFTSAGRTIYEVASIGTPAIVLAQNERELSHFFADSKYGFLNLGLGNLVDKHDLLDQFISLVTSKVERLRMNNKMKNQNLKLGRKKVNQLIQSVIEKEKLVTPTTNSLRQKLQA